MADNDNSLVLDILVKYLGEDQARAALADIEALKTTTGDLSASMPEGAAAFARYKNVLSATSSESLNLGGNTRLLALALRQAGLNIPGLHFLLRGLFNPATIGLVAGIGAIELYFHHLKKVEEQYKALVDAGIKVNDQLREIASARPTELAQWQKQVEMLDEMDGKLHGIAQSLQADADFARNFDTVMKGIDANKLESISESTKSRIAQIELELQLGLINKEHAEQLKLQAEYQGKIEEHAAERGKITDEIARVESAKGQAQTRLAGLGTKESAAAAKETAAAEMASLNKTLSDMPKVIAEQTKQISDISAGQLNRSVDERARDEKQIAQIYTERANNQRILDEATAKFPSADTAARAADANFTAITSQTEEVKKLQDKIVELKNSLGILDDKLSKLAPIEAQTANTTALADLLKSTGETPNEIFTRGTAALAAGEGGRRMSVQQQTEIQALQDLFTDLGWNSQQVISMLQTNHLKQSVLNSELMAVMRSIGADIDAKIAQARENTR